VGFCWCSGGGRALVRRVWRGFKMAGGRRGDGAKTLQTLVEEGLQVCGLRVGESVGVGIGGCESFDEL